MSPVLCRFEPPSGLLLSFPPACLLLMRFLTARSGCVHHPFTPARLSGMRRRIPLRLPQWRADAVEMAQDASIGLPDAGLVIRDRPRLTEGAHRRLGRFELVSREGGEEVMLKLIIESAKPEVGHRCARTLRAVRTCCRSRSSGLSPCCMSISLWLGAKTEPIYNPNSI